MPPKKSYIDRDGEAVELDEAFFREAKPTAEIPELVDLLTRHGKYGRPPLPPEARKKRVTLHLDPDVLDRLKSEGKGWQTRANAALRKALGL
ncbi:BrnA antitoxin family protein [Tabrizicola sp.]|uniref:BrnA antitoxin family protein n=1 Tax=Tabrizicola sp. TaxID=2005166 RepID=UPI0035B49837